MTDSTFTPNLSAPDASAPDTSRTAAFPRLDAHWIAFGLILVIGVAIRAWLLNQEMTFDESLTFLEYASGSLRTAITRYSLPNNHVFHTVLMWFPVRFLGDSPWILRLPVFIAGVLALPAAYAMGRLLYAKRNIALLTMAFMAASVWMIDYSANGRGYSIFTLILIVQVMLGAVLIRGWWIKRRWLLWGAYAVLCALGLWTVPTYVYPLASVCLWLLLSIVVDKRDKDRTRLLMGFFAAITIGAVLTIALYAPIWTRPHGIDQLFRNRYVLPDPDPIITAADAPAGAADANETIVPSTKSTTLEYLFEWWNRMLSTGLPTLVYAAFWIVAVIGVIAHGRMRDKGSARIPLAPIVFIATFGIIVVQGAVPPERTFVYSIPVFVLAAAVGVIYLADAIQRRTAAPQSTLSRAAVPALSVLLTVGLIAMLISTGDIIAHQMGLAPDSARVAAALSDRVTADDMLLMSLPYSAPVRYYLRQEGVPGVDARDEYSNVRRDLLVARDDANIYAFLCSDLPSECRIHTVDDMLRLYRLAATGVEVRFEPIESFPAGTLGELIVTQP